MGRRRPASARQAARPPPQPLEVPASVVAPPGGSYAPRPESARARQERVADEVLRDYGDEELSDDLSF